MIAQFMTLILVNTYTWMGGQGYCAYDFALQETGNELTELKITMKPEFDPNDTATGRTELDDSVLQLESIGGGAYNWGNTAKIENDCSVTGFTIVKATAKEDGKPVDLLKAKRIEIQKYEPLDIGLDKR